MSEQRRRSWAEPFKIKVVEPLKTTTREYREWAVAEAGYNTFLLQALGTEIGELLSLRVKAGEEEVKVRLDAKMQKRLEKIERTVTVYGLISLRTDGKRVLLAQKLEKPDSRGERDIYRLEPDKEGQLQYVPMH